MKNSILPIFLLILICQQQLHAQIIERQVIGSGGAFRTAGWGSLSATTGEALTLKLISDSLILTQGFQQPLQSDLGTKIISSNTRAIQVYPNPADDKINVVITSVNALKYSVAVIDLLGQKLDAPYMITNTSPGDVVYVFDLNRLANATYFVAVSDEAGATINTIKFTKIK